MALRAALMNFSKGMVAPEMEARFDLAAYQAGLRTANNVKIKRTGGVSKRMGTRFVAECLDGESRLIPFQFSDTQAYALEFGQATMRPYALGGAILETGQKITAISKEFQAVITVAYHGLEVGDDYYITSEDPETFGMTEILDRFLMVTEVIDANNFRVNITSTNFSDFGSDTGEVRTGAPDPAPAPPTVPTPIPTPTPPPVSSGGGGGYGTGGGWIPDRPGSYHF